MFATVRARDPILVTGRPFFEDVTREQLMQYRRRRSALILGTPTIDVNDDSAPQRLITSSKLGGFAYETETPLIWNGEHLATIQGADIRDRAFPDHASLVIFDLGHELEYQLAS
jgi:hypothetical protein